MAFLASSLHLCPMTMNNGNKLWSFCRRSFEALEELEDLVYTDRHVRELHNTLLWPLGEFLSALYECDVGGALLVQLTLACS